jgi:cytochrome d ubiquinol oxidase subunit II
MLLAAAGISIWTPLRHAYVAARWFAWPNFFYIALLPTAAFVSFLMLMRSLQKHHKRAPFFWSLGIFLFSFIGRQPLSVHYSDHGDARGGSRFP